MSITFIGDNFQSTNRVLSGCYSLDWALGDSLGNFGIPVRSVIEVYGAKNVGKSTFCFSLLGLIAKALGKNISILDWEGQSRETIEGVLVNQGFVGQVNYLLNKGDESSEDTLERFLEGLLDESQNVGLMDSIGAFRPTALLEGKIGDANMGVFAREMGQFAGKLINGQLRADEPGVVFLTNHVHPTIGGMVQGQITSGGEKKKYLAHVRIDLKRAFLGTSTADLGESFLLRGRIDSNRFGYSKREFHVFMVGGEGIHIGLTAMWDCIVSGLATLSAKKISESNTVSLDGQSMGKLGYIIKHRNDDPNFFVPFINALRTNDVEVPAEDEVEDEPKKKGKKK